MARGGLVDEAALFEFLRTHPDARYATDVVTHEPDYTCAPEKQSYRNPLLALSNVTYTPHIACLTPECQERIAVTIARRVADALMAHAVHAAERRAVLTV